MQQLRGNVTKMSGIEVDLIVQACSHLEIAFTLQGTLIADAQGKLERGEADVLLCGSEINSERLDVVEYSDPHTTSGLHVARLSEAARKQSLHRLVGLTFTSRAFIFLAAAVLTTATAAVVVSIAEKAKGSSQRHSLRTIDASELSNLLQAVEWAVGTMLPLTAVRLGPLLESSLARALATIAGIVAHLLVLLATAAAVCTVVMDGRKVDVTAHQAELDQLNVGVVKGAYSTEVLGHRKAMRTFSNFATLPELVKALSDGQIDAAVHEGKSLQAGIAAANIDHDRLILASLLPSSLPVHVAFQFVRDSKFRVPINRALYIIRQAGRLQQQQVVGVFNLLSASIVALSACAMPFSFMSTCQYSL